MKGMVFTEFLEMVEGRFGLAMADRIIEAAQLPSSGAYTAVGTYDYTEMVHLVNALSAATGAPQADLVKAFGRHLFERFSVAYSRVFASVTSAFEFLQNIERHIHVEVRKLYPDAELPSFNYEEATTERLVMVYHSRRPFADLAEGLIQGCIAHYAEKIELGRENLEVGTMNRVRFTLTKKP
jgi:Haem-NO-binding